MGFTADEVETNSRRLRIRFREMDLNETLITRAKLTELFAQGKSSKALWENLADWISSSTQDPDGWKLFGFEVAICDLKAIHSSSSS
jgi:hypothetical protein